MKCVTPTFGKISRYSCRGIKNYRLQNSGWSVGRDESVRGGVPGSLCRVGGEQHRHPEGSKLVGDLAHGGVTLSPRHVADVDGPDAAGVFVNDLTINLRVALAGIADQDEGEIHIRGEQRPNYAELVLVVVPQRRRAPILQEERAGRDAV